MKYARHRSENGWTRRSFLAALGVTGFAACDSDSGAGLLAKKPDGGTPLSDGGVPEAEAGAADAGDAGHLADLPWSAWKEIRAAVEKSPDCLAAQADALVAAKDPDAIFRFVRDRILSYPPRALEPVETSVRWGTRATLRGGAGTPRERAELLAELYRRAGFSADVVQGFRQGLLGDDAGLWASYTRIPSRDFDPQITDARLDELLNELGRPPEPPPELVDDGGTASGALADTLLAALPATFATDAQPFLPTVPTDGYIPLVRVTVGGQDQYANPLHPSATFGDPLAKNIGAADPATTPLAVSISLSVATTEDLTKRVEVVSANYGASDVVGRQVAVRFASLLDPRELAKVTLGDVTSFVPIIAVTSLDLAPQDADALTHSGTIVTVGGDLIVAEEGKPVTVNGIALSPPAGSSDAGAADIASISVTVLPQTFPQVEVRVTCTDSNGNPVNGLGPGALTVTDGGTRVGYLMRRNDSSAPRVAFLIDETLSQPATFIDSTKLTALGVSIGQVLYATFPGALVQVTALDGTPLTPDGYKATDAQGLGSAFGAAFGTQQPIYGDTASAIATSPSFVVLFSDGIVTESAGQVSVARGLLARGIPVITVTTAADPTKEDKATMQELASITGGTNIDAGDFSNVQSVLDALKATFEKIRAEPVALTYTATVLDPGQHDVVVTAANGVSGKATYTVPAASAASRPRALAGVYLTVKVGDTEVTRTLAGWNSPNPPAAGDAVPQALLDDVRGMLLGSAVIAFEAGAPTIGTLLDDTLGARLALRPAAEAVAAGSLDGLKAAVEHGVLGALERLSFLHAPPIPSNDVLTFEQGLRTVVLVSAPRFDGPSITRADVLGHANLTSLAKDPASAVRATLEASARVALGEGAIYDESTNSLLAGKKLVSLPLYASSPDQMTFAPAAERDAWSAAITPYAQRLNVVPDGGGTVAFYSVAPRSGDLIAVLGDGSGGGHSNADAARFNDAFYTLLKLLLSTLEIPGLGFVLAFGQFVVRVGNLAASCFDGSDPGFGDPLSSLAGDLASAGVSQFGKAVGGAVGTGISTYGKGNSIWSAAKAGATIANS